MAKNWVPKVSKLTQKISENVSGMKEHAHRELRTSGLIDKVEKVATNAKQFLDEKGISEKVEKTSVVVGEKLDTIAGHKHFKLLEERLFLQNQLNDILAEKLEEALARIDSLEEQLHALKKGA